MPAEGQKPALDKAPISIRETTIPEAMSAGRWGMVGAAQVRQPQTRLLSREGIDGVVGVRA